MARRPKNLSQTTSPEGASSLEGSTTTEETAAKPAPRRLGRKLPAKTPSALEPEAPSSGLGDMAAEHEPVAAGAPSTPQTEAKIGDTDALSEMGFAVSFRSRSGESAKPARGSRRGSSPKSNSSDERARQNENEGPIAGSEEESAVASSVSPLALEEFPFEISFRARQGGAGERRSRPSGRGDDRGTQERSGGDRPATGRKERGADADARGGSQTETPARELKPFDASEFEAAGLPIPTWRLPEAATEAESEQNEGSDELRSANRRRRSRRGRRGSSDRDGDESYNGLSEDGDEFEELEAPSFAEPEAPVGPSKREKVFIETPDDAPQIVLQNGVPTLVVDHNVVPPLSLYVDLARSSRKEDALAQVRLAAESGVHLFRIGLNFSGSQREVTEEVIAAREAIAALVSADPKAQILLRLDLQAPRGWEGDFPDAAYRNREGKLALPSIADDRYWEEVGSALGSFAESLVGEPGLIGMTVDREGWAVLGGYDGSPAASVAFCRWLRERYLNDRVMLRAAWFDGGVDFENALAPDRSAKRTSGTRFLRAERRSRRYVDTHLFLSDLTVARIADLAYTVKEASGGRLLFGVRYGDTFDDVDPVRGQFSLGKLLRTPEVDIVFGRLAASGAPSTAVDSIALNGKLYLAEADYPTSLGADAASPNDVVRSPQALENLHLRDLGLALAHAGGNEWVDATGRGSLNAASVWRRAQPTLQSLELSLVEPVEAPEVAVFLDERALAYLEDHAAFAGLLRDTRDAVLRAGVSVGFYLLSDLAHRERFPESRLYIFLNAWDLRSEARAAIKTRLQKEGKVLMWLYAAGLFDGGRDSLERVREITGIALRPQPFASHAGTAIVDRRHPLAAAFVSDRIGTLPNLEPTYSAIPEDALVLGEYAATGLPSFVARRIAVEGSSDEWTSIFLGEPAVNPALIRAAAGIAGAHVWSFNDDLVNVRPPFLTITANAAGPRALALPLKWTAAEWPNRERVSLEASTLRLSLGEGGSQSYLVGTRDRIDALLDTDLASVRRVENIPPRESNVRTDASNFEVAIVKLSELGDTGEEGEVADEWFLRPPAIAETPKIEGALPVLAGDDSTTRTGRRRTRRRGGRAMDDEPIAGETGRVEVEATNDSSWNMNVVFRKRD